MRNNGTAAALPKPYSREWVLLPEPYVNAVAAELESRGVRVDGHWNDPMDPRDVTVIVSDGAGKRLRFVWDEESGWRFGRMDEQGWVPLAAVRYLPGGLLPEPEQVADIVEGVLGGTVRGVPERPQHRSFHDYGDGFDRRLAAYGTAAVR
ncbi:hypothetical protein HDA32_000708 [Spinactinospora alkalitolerans]|uniref:DUF6292 domain-containing protein n=1 Tax=Spinactinospora alkalitolerans TaxID=687207 RepID=A0A852TNR2_9ACTN|nr:DUF6292 family protein [Spinactinospora alkalitolerans]NYE45588.1 hypothetical protein [Spinactinospora alkalitolerans]